MRFRAALIQLISLGVWASPTALDLVKRQEPQEPSNTIIPSPVNHTANIDACQGYQLTNATVRSDSTGVDGTLTILGNCSAYGPDYPTLTLSVSFETADRLRVRITDTQNKAHIVPDDVASWPAPGTNKVDNGTSNLDFQWQENPFGFKVVRKSDGEVLFNTIGQKLVFEEQFVRFSSKLSEGSNIQGLGQHNDNFTLPIQVANYTRTLWTRDSYSVPSKTNLYGAHPIYVNQKVGQNASAHGVFLLNSHGMDVRFPESGQYIEYSILGGIIDLFFLNGPGPADVARQASDIWGKAAETPYWALGFHSCKYGYEDIAEVAEVVNNYTAAGIPVQTQWMDIDYMYERWIQTLDPDRFPIEKVRYVVSLLQQSGRDFIVMVDPATFSGTPNSSIDDYETYQTGVQQDVFLKYDNGDLYEGVVWPGPTVFPDWTAPNAQSWWTSEFARFFSAETGVDVSGIWLDMNEPANFLPYLEANIYRISQERPVPPPRVEPRVVPRTIPDFPRFEAGQNISSAWNGSTPSKRSYDFAQIHARQSNVSTNSTGSTGSNSTNSIGTGSGSSKNYTNIGGDSLEDYLSPSLDSQWLYPPYMIQDRRQAPSTSDSSSETGLKNISDFSARTDLVQANGARTYDEHNLYGSRHAIVTREALRSRRPGQKAFTIARSSFSGTPSGLWLGDNLSQWDQYIQTIRQMLGFAAIYGVGMVGADSCGFGGNSTETLCARWAWLGAFNTFYRNHNELGNIPQEFYRWNLTTTAARAAGQTRLRLLDYTYSFLHKHSVDGTPAMWPLSWVHPTDTNTVNIEHQFYYGPNLLVSPVVNENSTSVTFYVPNSTYYDFFTLEQINGTGSNTTLDNVEYDTMPLHIHGGGIVPLRTGNRTENTVDENRKLPFHLVIAPNATNQAEGYLRLDDGITEDIGDNYSDIYFTFDGNSINVSGTFGYQSSDGQEDGLDMIVIAGQQMQRKVSIDGQEVAQEKTTYDADKKTLTVFGLGERVRQMSVTLQ